MKFEKKLKLKLILEFWGVLGDIKKPWKLRFNRVYFTIFRGKGWNTLIFELILLLENQTNCKNWVWKEKSINPSMCSHC
jgi:hypothetical protein